MGLSLVGLRCQFASPIIHPSNQQLLQRLSRKLGSGCGSVGRVDDSDTRDPQLESCYRPILYTNNWIKSVLKDKNKGKRDREWPILIKKTPSRNRHHLMVVLCDVRGYYKSNCGLTCKAFTSSRLPLV